MSLSRLGRLHRPAASADIQGLKKQEGTGGWRRSAKRPVRLGLLASGCGERLSDVIDRFAGCFDAGVTRLRARRRGGGEAARRIAASFRLEINHIMPGVEKFASCGRRPGDGGRRSRRRGVGQIICAFYRRHSPASSNSKHRASISPRISTGRALRRRRIDAHTRFIRLNRRRLRLINRAASHLRRRRPVADWKRIIHGAARLATFSPPPVSEAAGAMRTAAEARRGGDAGALVT